MHIHTSILHITTACLVLGSTALGEDRYTPPAFDGRLPMNFTLPPNAVPGDGKSEGLGLWQHQGFALPETRGVHPIFVTSAPPGTVNGGPFKPGDVILGIEGEPLGPNPTRQFREIISKETRDSGLVWVARWRDGKVERIMVDIGTMPLDLTRGAPHNAYHEDTALGATGAHGWIWAVPHESTEGATQIYVTRVDPGSPAEAVLKPGDVILGANGASFTRDARRELGGALAVAESTEKQGKLTLHVWREGHTGDFPLQILEMGDYTPTSPFECKKAELIRSRAAQVVSASGIAQVENDTGRRIIGNLGALGLLATGDPAYLPEVRARAHAMAAKGQNLSFNLAREAWDWSYNNIFLCEYYLLTGDKTVLPAIREFAVKTAEGQSRVGTWGHSMSIPYQFADGPRYGIAPGYGALNSAGIPCAIALILARECGVDDEVVTDAIGRSANFFRFYVDKGTIPYGDHPPFINSHENNGMNSMCAVMFDLLGDAHAADFFTRLTLASFNDREPGHTGNYFSFLWGTLGAARGGADAAAAFMNELRWFYDLERQWQGNFSYQGKPGMIKRGNGEHSFADWDCTGARLLAYCLPQANLRITGRGKGHVPQITGAELGSILAAGRMRAEDYAALGTDALLGKLSSWSPAVRQRAAEALAGKPENVVHQLIAMLRSDDRYTRYGACQGLRHAGRASTDAADALMQHGLGSNDATLRFYAMQAFTHPDPKLGLNAVSTRAAATMLQLAGAEPPIGPHDRQQLGDVLFGRHDSRNRRPIFPNGEGLEDVERELLISAIRALLKETNGLTRSSVATIYNSLTPDDLDLLWGDIHVAVEELAPSGIMFADGVQMDGIRLLARHRIKQGLQSAVQYLRYQKPHASQLRVTEVLGIIVNDYGGHAKAFIPQMEAHATYFDGGEPNFPTHLSKQKAVEVREAIRKIQALPDPAESLVDLSALKRN